MNATRALTVARLLVLRGQPVPVDIIATLEAAGYETRRFT